MKREIEEGFATFCEAAMELEENCGINPDLEDIDLAGRELIKALNALLELTGVDSEAPEVPANLTPLTAWLWKFAAETGWSTGG